ncbi:MAG: NAD(P)-dependent oxidoreductase, partial [Pseudomonadota bacterium]
LDQMLPRVDFLSVNCPATPATTNMLSEERLKQMQKDAIIINTARGQIVDEDALIRAISLGMLGGAGLDVFAHGSEIEPELKDLMRTGKVVLLPHMGSATKEGRMEMGERVLINIRTWVDQHRPPDRVLPNQE